MEGETQTLKNMLKFNDNYLEFTRKGPMSVHMIFEKGKKNLTYYYTPFGSIQIGIDATSIEVKETEDEIRAEVKYALDVNYEFVGDCHINIAVKKKRRSSQNCIKVCQAYGVKKYIKHIWIKHIKNRACEDENHPTCSVYVHEN